MVSKSKAKGSYHERWFLKLFNSLGIKTKKQPLSGSLGGEYKGDLTIEIDGQVLFVEVKYRDKSNFPSPYKVLEGRDIAFYKRRTGKPQTLVIMDGDLFAELVGEYGTKKQNNDKETICDK